MLLVFLLSLPPWSLLALLAIPVIGGAVYYLAAVAELRSSGGRVSGQYFGLPDLFMGGALAAYFAWGGFLALSHGETAVEIGARRLLENSAFMLTMLAVVVVFALFRGIPFARAIGLEWSKFFPSLFRAVVSLGTALPLVWAVNLLAKYLFPEQAREQVMVSLFRSASETGDWSTVRVVFVSAVIVAPLVEETIFRGYFYATTKRYAGPIGAVFWTSVLFALSHGNVTVMAGLFALSVCLTVAYERYGSLWVSIGMHACFNAISLTLLYLQGRGWLPS